MEDVQKGDLVLSLNGRDQGKALFVAEVDDLYVVLVDGKSRKLEHPKRKKIRHCKFLAREASRVAEKLRTGERVTNVDVRRALAAFHTGEVSQSDDETGGGS
ncbi:MAG: KOW domain-containing RNA-binding protein [Oscillospiraceae bacterium]|nr:KOW domain-containing RNA-binding protein [Oscillospiraceae bacterium]